MRRHKRPPSAKAIPDAHALSETTGDVGIVLSGGGSRAAYQAGALKALAPFLNDPENPIKIIVGSSIGAINGLILAACLNKDFDHAVELLHAMWSERSFKNTFDGHPSMAFLRAIRMAFFQYLSPGPKPTSDAIFDPAPLMKAVDTAIRENGGLHPESRAPHLSAVAAMTTVEGVQRKPMLFVSSHKRVEEPMLKGAAFEVCYVDELHAKHGFASAALPSVLPPVELDTEHGTVHLVDGGISSNVPIDQAMRLGAERIICIDISGRYWWLEQYDEPLDTRPDWEIPAQEHTFCLRPPHIFYHQPAKALGPVLQHAVASSTRKFITAVGPTWPCFTLLKQKLGEAMAYEVMTYVALDRDYLEGLMELGYNETRKRLLHGHRPSFSDAPRDGRLDTLSEPETPLAETA